MTEPDFSALGAQHTLGDQEVPKIVVEFADRRGIDLLWRNDLGGLTFRAGDVVVKWNPRSTGIDLDRERVRLDWIAVGTRHRGLLLRVALPKRNGW